MKKIRPDTAKQPTVSAEGSDTWRTIRNLWPYMWPGDRPDLKARVVWAMVILVLAKVITVLVPYFYKWSTGALTGDNTTPGWMPAFLVVPVMLVIAYNVGRVAMTGFS
ncbi:MAG: metal ABC transporter permease, partial [Nitratireductor sp.]|nr:metal ABC transporter permease [Nitratireductor sp.]